MLRKLTLNNFKAWRSLDMEFGKVTGLFGTNSSGKSSILQFLLMLKQTKDATDRRLVLDMGSPDGLVNLGSFRDVVHRHDAGETLSWELDWSLPDPIRIENPMGDGMDFLFEGDKIRAKCEVGLRKGIPWASKLEYVFDDTAFSLTSDPSKPTEFNLDCDHESFSFLRNRGRPWPLPGPVKTHLFPDQVGTYHQNAHFVSDFGLAHEDLMNRIFYLGPLRDYPKREYLWAGASPSDVGRRGERTIDAILSASANGEERQTGPRRPHSPFQEFIADQLNGLGLIESFRVDEIAAGSNIYRAMVKTDKANAEVLLTDVGVGVSQVLPVLVLLFYVPSGSTVIMEQPEIHLHPSVQSELADVILMASSARNIQVIVESHSEHMLRRFQRRVAEENVSVEDIRLYFTSMLNGAAQLSDLNLNEWGEIQNWPENFFGDELGEIAATQIAGLKRKIGGAA